jgi:hypothetical protein
VKQRSRKSPGRARTKANGSRPSQVDIRRDESPLRANIDAAPGAAQLAMPHDPTLPERARELWLSGEWQSLGQLDTETVAHHPARALLTALQASAAQQSGDRVAARTLARRALQWGCPREELGQALLAGARHTLARASVLARREQQAQGHFERAVAQARLSSEVRRLAQTRRDRLDSDLRQAVAASAKLRKGGTEPTALHARKWLVALADQCLQARDLHDAVDHALADLVTLADDRMQLLMLMSDRMLARDDRMTAMHFLNSARWFVDEAQSESRTELMRKLVSMGAAQTAMDIAMAQVLDGETRDDAQGNPVAGALRNAYDGMRQAATSRIEHGHELLLSYLEIHRTRLQQLAAPRRLTVIEIGTTREDVPGQGSTLKLAQYCLRHQMHFITVDMDPHNSRMAQSTFARLGAAGFEAVTRKGEDYLREREGDMDLVFLDAYDFDHGKHSELRQSRYEKYLGARIDEQACHRMHLDCAESLVSKLWKHGVVCIDDTWTEHDAWTAKGTLAMPYLLSHGFDLVDARNRAALLVRQGSGSA